VVYIKLYHIDRSGLLQEKSKIEHIESFDYLKPVFKENLGIIKERYDNKLSLHGRRYFLDEYNAKSCGMDIIFEYERIINYPNKLSRFQSFFAFDIEGVFQFIEKKELDFEFFKVYEVEYDYYEKHDMNLIRGWSNYDTIINSKYYWENIESYRKEKPIYEYLLRLPVVIKKEVTFDYLQEEYNKYKSKSENKEQEKIENPT